MLSYPEETREVLDSLYSLWFDHLWDNIPTVRENSASALANTIRAYGEEATTKVVAVLRWVRLRTCGCDGCAWCNNRCQRHSQQLRSSNRCFGALRRW